MDIGNYVGDYLAFMSYIRKINNEVNMREPKSVLLEEIKSMPELLSHFTKVYIFISERKEYWRSAGAGCTFNVKDAGIYDIQDAYERTLHYDKSKGIKFIEVIESNPMPDLTELKKEFENRFVTSFHGIGIKHGNTIWQWIEQNLLTSDLHKGVFRGLTQEMINLVPQTYGEAIQKFPFIDCLSHEWDNRTTIENAFYLVEQFNKIAPKQSQKGDWINVKEKLISFCNKEIAFHKNTLDMMDKSLEDTLSAASIKARKEQTEYFLKVVDNITNLKQKEGD